MIENIVLADGAVKRFTAIIGYNSTANGESYPVTRECVRASDYDRLQSELTAAQKENADINAAFNAFCKLAREQQEYERAQLTASQQRIAELELELYDYHNRTCFGG